MNSFTEAPTYFRATLSKNNLLHPSGTFFQPFAKNPINVCLFFFFFLPFRQLYGILYLILFHKENSYTQVDVNNMIHE